MGYRSKTSQAARDQEFCREDFDLGAAVQKTTFDAIRDDEGATNPNAQTGVHSPRWSNLRRAVH
jgi:hypothetical protein